MFFVMAGVWQEALDIGLNLAFNLRDLGYDHWFVHGGRDNATCIALLAALPNAGMCHTPTAVLALVCTTSRNLCRSSTSMIQLCLRLCHLSLPSLDGVSRSGCASLQWVRISWVAILVCGSSL